MHSQDLATEQPGIGTSSKSVLVLGGTGFIGQAVLARLASERHYACRWTARADAPEMQIDDLPRPMLIEDLETLDLSVLDEVDVVVNMISRGRGRLAPGHDVVGRIRGQARLLDGIIHRGWQGHFIYLSSGGTIYGPCPPAMCTEDMPIAPAGDYALEKAMVEMHILSAARQTGMAATILRVANAYGERQPAKLGFGVIPAILSAASGGNPFVLYGEGTSRRDYIHVDDIAEAILAAIERPDAGIVNIGSGVGTSVRELLARIEAGIGRGVPVKQGPKFGSDPETIVLDVTRAMEKLAWVPRVGLDEGVSRILAFHGLASESGSRSV